MAQPPKFKRPDTGEIFTYFDHLVEEIQPAFEAYGVHLDFSGYNDLMESYAMLDLKNPQVSWELARDFNLWTNYLLECLGVTQKLLLDSEATKKATIAQVSIKQDGRNVSNGERLANKTEEVVNIRKVRNAYKSFHDLLKLKLETLKQAHYFCKATWEYQNEKELYAKRGR